MAKPFVKPSKKELKKMLTPIQYKVTQHEGTETAFNNEYAETSGRASMLILSVENRCSAPWTNMIRGRAGRALRGLSNRGTS